MGTRTLGTFAAVAALAGCNSDDWLAGGLLATFFLLPLVFILFFGALLVSLLVRMSRVFEQSGAALAENVDHWLAGSGERLAVLGRDELPDLAARLVVDGRTGFGRLHYRGRVPSLAAPQRAYIDFDEQLKFGAGLLRLRTRTSGLELAIPGVGVTRVLVSVDGVPVGFLERTEDEVVLVGENGRVRGRYHRHPLTFLGLRVEAPRLNLEPYYGPVELDGRVVAELNRNPLIVPDGLAPQLVPLLRNVVADLTDEEQAELMAFVAYEIHTKILVSPG